MPALGSRKDPTLRTVPVSFSLPGGIVEALDAEVAAGNYGSRSKLLTHIVEYWLANKPEPDPQAVLIQEDLDRFRNFVR